MTTFYCVRHGKTEFNLNKIFQGGLVDSPLLPEGLENATKVGNALKDIDFAGVFVSPQKRAQDTAQNIISAFDTSQKITTVKDLREMEFGSWDGQPEKDYYEHEQFINLTTQPHLFDPTTFGGESFQTVVNRSIKAFNKISEEYPDGNVLIVSHGLTLQCVLKSLTGQSVTEMRDGSFLDNTSITTVKKEAKTSEYTLLNWNDTKHLL